MRGLVDYEQSRVPIDNNDDNSEIKDEPEELAGGNDITPGANPQLITAHRPNDNGLARV